MSKRALVTLSFDPHYTPIEMFKMGIFGGNYFKIKTVLPKQFILDCQESNIQLFNNTTDYSKNHFYKKPCGKDYDWWIGKGLINTQDVNGWVEWYIKYYYGRRCDDDLRQIRRFNAFVIRHLGVLRYNQSKGRDVSKMRQNLLQWAYSDTLDLNVE